MGGGNRDVVIETETHRAIALGMVAWRAHQRKCRLARVEGVLRRLHGRTSGQSRNLDRLRRRIGIRIEHHRPSRGRLDLAQVLIAVHPFELLARDRTRRCRRAAAHGPSVRHRVEHVRALHALGMARRGDVFFESGRGNEQHRPV